jgi:hypothetical protein
VQLEADGIAVWQGEAFEVQLVGIGVLHQVLQFIPLVIGQMGRGDLEGSTVEAVVELNPLEQALGPSQSLCVAEVNLLANINGTKRTDDRAHLVIGRVERVLVGSGFFRLDSQGMGFVEDAVVAYQLVVGCILVLGRYGSITAGGNGLESARSGLSKPTHLAKLPVVDI